MKKKMVPIVCFSIFAVIGIAVILCAVWVFVRGMQFRKTAVSVTAKIEDINTSYDNDGDAHHQVFVTYTFEGQTYEKVSLNEYSSNMYVGKSIDLLCDPKNPGRVETNSNFYIVVIVLSIMGIVSFCVGAIPLCFSIKKILQKKRLLEKGRVLHATVGEISLNTSLAVNGQNPYIIYCTWYNYNTGCTVRFKSENLWTDPSNVFGIGSEIDVYVDENNLSKYYVDAERPLSEKVMDFT